MTTGGRESTLDLFMVLRLAGMQRVQWIKMLVGICWLLLIAAGALGSEAFAKATGAALSDTGARAVFRQHRLETMRSRHRYSFHSEHVQF